MKSSSRWIAAISAACVISTSGQTSTSLANAERASSMTGNEVVANGQRVGKLDNLIIDLESGRVLYAVVDLGKDKVGVPPLLFTDTTGKTLKANVDASKFKDAPKLDAQGANLGSAAYVSKVHKYFGQNEWWAGSTPSDQGSFNNAHRVSDLKNVRVVNVSDQPLGDIKDVVVDLPPGRILYVLLDPASDLGLGKNLYALPPQTFTATTKSGKTAFSVNADKEKLSAAPHLTENEWSKLRDQSFASAVYSYYGKQPYFASTTSGSLQPTGRESGQYNTGSNTISTPSDTYDRTGTNRTWNRGNRPRVNSSQSPSSPQSGSYDRTTK